MAPEDTRSAWRNSTAGAVILAATLLAGCSDMTSMFKRASHSTGAVVEEPTVQIGTVSGRSSIPVLVNDVPITRYDIDQRVRLMRIGGAQGGEKAAIDELINETLQMFEGARQGVRVPDARVNAAYATIARNLQLSPAQLTDALRGEGIDDDSLKKRLRAQITWQELVQRRVQTTAQVRTTDITEALLARGDPQEITTRELMLQQIVFVVPSGSAAGVYDQRRREAEAFRQRYRGCDNALEQAQQLRGVVVKDLGRRDSSQLTGAQGQEILGTAVGKTARPNQTSQGIELIAVCSSRDIHSTAVARSEIENELYLAQSQDLGKDYLAELRDRAIIEYR